MADIKSAQTAAVTALYGCGKTDDNIEKDVDAVYVADIIDRYIWGRHAERNRQILKRRLIDGICYEPLAEEFEMSVRQIQNIVYRFQPVVFKHL